MHGLSRITIGGEGGGGSVYGHVKLRTMRDGPRGVHTIHQALHSRIPGHMVYDAAL